MVSFGMSLTLIWWQVTPESIDSVTTVQLLVTLGLAALPWLTYAAWRFDFTAGRRGPSPKAQVDRRTMPHGGHEHARDRLTRENRRHRRAPAGRIGGAESAGSGRIRD